MNPRWDKSNQRWECSIGSGKTRVWFRTRIAGEQGREICQKKRDRYLHGPAPLIPGSLAEFIEAVWWPKTKAKCTTSTLADYRSILTKHISRFYAYKLDDLRLEVLQPWISSLDLSPKRVCNIYGVMSGIMELARLTDRYHRHDHRLVALPEVPRTRRVDLNIDKVRALIATAQGTEMEGPSWAASHFGLRRNEVCGLKRPHVVLHGETATITIQDNRQPHGETHKLKSKRTGAARVLEVPRAMAERLLSFAEPDALYLFSYMGKPIHPVRLTARMPELCRQAGVPKMEFRELRSACRSNLKAAGVPEVDIMRILGHTNYSTSLLYQDERPAAQVEAFSKLMEL